MVSLSLREKEQKKNNNTCVAMPAWSIPGTHNVLYPEILRQRIIVSYSKEYNAFKTV